MHHARRSLVTTLVSLCRCYALRLVAGKYASRVCRDVHDKQGGTLPPLTTVTFLSLRLGSGTHMLCNG